MRTARRVASSHSRAPSLFVVLASRTRNDERCAGTVIIVGARVRYFSRNGCCGSRPDPWRSWHAIYNGPDRAKPRIACGSRFTQVQINRRHRVTTVKTPIHVTAAAVRAVDVATPEPNTEIGETRHPSQRVRINRTRVLRVPSPR